MHGVTKKVSTTTKLRAVFDGSAAATTGILLNDVLLTGRDVYSPFPDILLRFRLHKVGLTADVSKMFRMIELHPFGVTSSLFIAAQTLRRIAMNTTPSSTLKQLRVY